MSCPTQNARPGAGQHHRAHGGIGRLGQGGAQRRVQILGQRVQPVGPVQRDGRDGARACQLDVRHAAESTVEA